MKEDFPWGYWLGVDLDGTLSHYDKFISPLHIGAPIPAMIAKVQARIAAGVDVRIFTARLCDEDGRNVAAVVAAIEAWCQQHIGKVLPVTNRKDPGMFELWDDRCRQVIPNTGEFVQ